MEQTYIEYATMQKEHWTFDISHEQYFSKHQPHFTYQLLSLSIMLSFRHPVCNSGGIQSPYTAIFS